LETVEVLEIAARGEDSRHQFKRDATNATSLAAEMVAFSNSGGGTIFIGVDDGGAVRPLNGADVRRINQLIGNVASTMVLPSINPHSENVAVEEGVVIVVTIADGISKPYMDNTSAIWVKSGSDKRKVTAREEMQRMFQTAQLVHGDDIPIATSSIADVDLDYFRRFYSVRYEQELDEQEQSLSSVLSNMRLSRNGLLTVTGALLFAREPQALLPVFYIKAVRYPGNDVHVTAYLDSVDISGKLQAQFDEALSFIARNLHRQQGEQGVNTIGELEVPRIVLEELLANALMHRDYFVSAPIRIFIFDDRIELLSPGGLPNSLTVANIRTGNSNIRNPILVSFASRLLPYRGLGTGIIRALRVYPSIKFENDKDGNLFCVTIPRVAVTTDS
jgi:ATP-dependent DNA helicase RecG